MNAHLDYFLFGKILKPIGIIGELLINFESDQPDKYLKTESIFVEIHGRLVPFFIKNYTLRYDNKAVIIFEDVDVDFAESLKGCRLFLPANLLPKLKGIAFYYHEVKGFDIIDKTLGNIGTINEVLEYPGNPLFSLINDNKELLIPINNDFILKLDRKNKQIQMDIPESFFQL